ncbi:P-loop NTPase fold protein [Raoultibacter massiliensis]|uniref:P-loop NTPase fold protein n=1 Tax=Raoultibacter massiliensis TaxID=1852371 RepID=A0ABV1JG53_9ACTN
MGKTTVGQGNTEWILQQITTNYLRKSDLHYAIAIEGEWGSGKTRFLKTKLEEELNKEGIGLKIVYVSLFGISDSNDLYRRIMAAMLPLSDPNGNKIGRAFQYILKLMRRAASEGLAFFRIFPKVNFSIDPELFTSLFLPRKHLLILDDTERRSANCDDLSLFGAVNDLVENKGVKTILVSNSFSPKCAETDEADGPKKSTDVRGFDSEVREKLVWRCLRFKPSLEDIAKSVFADPADGQDRIDIIVQAARMANCGNVRAFLKSKSFIEDLLAADKNYLGDAARKNRQSALQELISFALLICLGKKPVKPEKPDYASDDIPGIFRLQNQNERYARFSSFGCFNDYFGDSNGPSLTQLPEEYISYLERWYPQNDDTINMSELTNK